MGIPSAKPLGVAKRKAGAGKARRASPSPGVHEDRLPVPTDILSTGVKGPSLEGLKKTLRRRPPAPGAGASFRSPRLSGGQGQVGWSSVASSALAAGLTQVWSDSLIGMWPRQGWIRAALSRYDGETFKGNLPSRLSATVGMG